MLLLTLVNISKCLVCLNLLVSYITFYYSMGILFLSYYFSFNILAHYVPRTFNKVAVIGLVVMFVLSDHQVFFELTQNSPKEHTQLRKTSLYHCNQNVTNCHCHRIRNYSVILICRRRLLGFLLIVSYTQ